MKFVLLGVVLATGLFCVMGCEEPYHAKPESILRNI